jgi:hypothetical protein
VLTGAGVRPRGVQKLSQHLCLSGFRNSRIRFAWRIQEIDQPGALLGTETDWRVVDVDPVDLIFARAREPESVEAPKSCDVVATEADRVSGCVFVFVDQAAEQVGAV